MLPTVLEEPEENTVVPKPSTPIISTASFQPKYLGNKKSPPFDQRPIVVIRPGKPDFEVKNLAELIAMSESTGSSPNKETTTQVVPPNSPAGEKSDAVVLNGGESLEKERRDSENKSGEEGEQRRSNGRRPKNGRGRPQRQPRQERRRSSYARSWEKTHHTGMVVTNIISPTVLYMQTPQQQEDHAKLRECLAKSYDSKECKPSLVAANMLLGVKIGDYYERVRTEEKVDQAAGVEGETSQEWTVTLLDKGDSACVKESNLSFLVAGLSDILPLAVKYTLNELRVLPESTPEQITEARQWLVDQIGSSKVDCDVYRQTRDHSSILYADLYIEEKWLNKEMCNLEAIEPKMRMRWTKKDNRTSTSSVEDVPLSPTSVDDVQETVGLERSNDVEVSEDTKDAVERTSEEKPDDLSAEKISNADSGSRSAARRQGGRGGRRWHSGGNRRRNQQLPPLQDWAVLNYDSCTDASTIRSMCEMMERSDNRVSPPDSIVQQLVDPKDMVATLTDVLVNHPRLMLLLCVPPEDMTEYGELEKTGRRLGVCVVCVRGSTLADPSTATASKLLRELQQSLLQSPVIMTNPIGGMNGGQRRRRDNRGRRGNNRQRGNFGNRGAWDGNGDALQSAIDSLLSTVRQTQSYDQSFGGFNNPNKESLNKAVQSLEDLQNNYKQVRGHCLAALGAATNFFLNLSPPVST